MASALAVAFVALLVNARAEAADLVGVAVWNNTGRVAMFEVRRGNGSKIAFTDVVGPGEITMPVGGDPRKFKIKAFVWNEQRNRWNAATYWIPFINRGSDLFLEFHYTGNGTSLTISETAN
jgi:hypothetical protein